MIWIATITPFRYALLVAWCLLTLPAWAQDDPGEDPDLELDEIIDISEINPLDFSMWDFSEMIDQSILTDALNPTELVKMFDIDFENITSSSLDFRPKDLLNKKKKKMRFMQNETVKWIFNFLLSEQLANYLKKAHSVYVLITDTERKDHEKFFQGMLIVSAGVKASSQFVDFVVALKSSYLRIEQVRKLLNENRELFSDQEYAYFAGSLSNILMQKQDYLSDFEKITTDNVLQMEDGERIKLIDRLTQVANMSDKALYQLAILLKQVINQRGQAQLDMGQLRILYGIEDHENE